ncbi:MAG: hypothetical protein E7294_05715 [Lachnospiraceae bacterium]|jgi:hypothetical protein|nr:hypothetical protein [Lachnospiraceae bacterium]
MKQTKRFISSLLIVCMLIGSLPVPGFQMEAKAAVTKGMSFVGVNTDSSGDGYYYNASDKILTLENGFVLNTSGEGTSAMTLKPGTTIVLKGNAEIRTDETGIDAIGNLTIESADDVNGKLSIICTQVGAGSTYKYGIRM